MGPSLKTGVSWILKIRQICGFKETNYFLWPTGIAIGMPVNDFNEMKDLEVVTFRRNIMHICKGVVEERESQGIDGQALYVYPPDIHASPKLPNHIMQNIKKGWS